mgnify:FL=1
MKKSLFAWAVVLPVTVLSVLTACTRTPLQDPITVGISADAVFSENGEANIKISLSSVPENEVVVNLAVSSEAQSGYTAAGAEYLTFDNSATISGTSTATVTVKADVAALDDDYQAVITIASTEGLTIDEEAATVYIGVPTNVARQMAGASVWSIIGSFNGWSGDIELTKTADDPETWTVENATFGGEFKFRGNNTWDKYDLGSSESVVLGSDLALTYKGSNIKIDEGVYNVTLYPTLLKAVITEGEAAPKPFELDWTVEYQGLQWIEGFYTYGQLDVFEVSNTDKSKYYAVFYSELDNEYMESYGESLKKDPEGFFAMMQENIDSNLEYYAEYGYSIDDYLYDYCYNEVVDGTTVLFYGQPAGEYEFLVLSMDKQAQLDMGYKYITITKDTDPEYQYDWDFTPNIREDWTGTPAGWYEGYEGQYFWIDGYAPGAAYTIIDLYTDEEIDRDLNGELKNFIGNTYANIQEYLDEGYSPDEVFEYLGAAVDPDGHFSDYVSTYGIEGEANLLILGFDKNGQLINTSAYANGADMGKVVIEVPVYVQEPLDLKLNENWSATFLGTYYDEEYEMDLSVIEITGLSEGEYVGAGLYGAGYIDEENLSDYVRYEAEGVFETYNYYYYEDPNTTLADVACTVDSPWLFYSGVTEEHYGDWDLLMAGVSSDFEITGEFAIATITIDGTRLEGDPTVSKSIRKSKANLSRISSRKHTRHAAKTDASERPSRPAAVKAGADPAARKAPAGKPTPPKAPCAKLSLK